MEASLSSTLAVACAEEDQEYTHPCAKHGAADDDQAANAEEADQIDFSDRRTDPGAVLGMPHSPQQKG